MMKTYNILVMKVMPWEMSESIWATTEITAQVL